MNKDNDLKTFTLEVLAARFIEETTCLEYSPHEINHQSKAYIEIKRRVVGGYDAGYQEGHTEGFDEGWTAFAKRLFEHAQALMKAIR